MRILSIRPSRILLALAISLTGDAMAQIPQRKNIDLLTPGELAAYEHAIQILKDRSDANPYDRSGYLWQAWVHNCPFIWEPAGGVGAKGSHTDECDTSLFKPDPSLVEARPGICEHRKDLFLVWHRAEFYYFEQILRRSDPDGTVKDSRGLTGPSTSNVAIPFWNWTRPPSGKRYAKAFEDPNSPLFHQSRNQDPLNPPEQEFFAQITSAKAVAALVYDPDWKKFGGYPQEAPTGGRGRFESGHHDPMHGSYFGGDMADPSRAALDPAFYSFHAYIDLVFQFWLDQHGFGSVTSPNNFLRATQPDNIAPPPGHVQGAGIPSMGQARIYFDPANLGYGYEVTNADKLPAPAIVAAALAMNGVPARFGETDRSPHARLAGDGLFDPGRGPPTMVLKIPVQIRSSPSEVQAALQRPHDAPDVSFNVDFYLHPAAVDLDPTKKPERAKYIVDALGHFGTGRVPGSGHGDEKPLYADLTPAVKDLLATGHGGETWTLTAVVSGQPLSSNFGVLSLAP